WREWLRRRGLGQACERIGWVMKDWRKTGQDLFEEQVAEDYAGWVWRIKELKKEWVDPTPDECELRDALNEAYFQGKWTRLIDYIRSDRPLTRKGREDIANNMRVLTEKPSMGRPRNDEVR